MVLKLRIFIEIALAVLWEKKKNIMDSKWVEVIAAASALLSVVRKLSSFPETALVTHLSPSVTPMLLQPCI